MRTAVSILGTARRLSGMATPRHTQVARPDVVRDDADHLSLTTDVLVIGGGPAATWAAIRAREAGARVVLVDKGYCGTSGVAATAGVGHWLVAPDAERRDEQIGIREEAGAHLTDRDWTNDVLDVVWDRTAELDDWGYTRLTRDRQSTAAVVRRILPTGTGRTFMGQAPHYLRFLRGRVKKLGATILDHSPALELLRDDDGRISGAQGYQRQIGRPWSVSAGAVILATGGTTWKSHSLGGDVNTGDGHLMAAEVGAHLSSMEFSNFYGMVPFGTSMDKNGFFVQASYTDERGEPIAHDNLHVSRTALLAASLQGTVYAQFTQFDAESAQVARQLMPNFFMVADKLGVDVFDRPFPMDWVQEGTVRGTGGLHVLDRECSTGVPGLYAAGDVAARDRIVGAATGAGGPNLAWAIASGTWAAQAATTYATGRGPLRPADVLEPTGTVGLRPAGGTATPDAWSGVVAATRDEMLPIEKSVLRTEEGLRGSLAVLDDLWAAATESLGADGAEAIRTREAAGMLAMARWANTTAIERRETRGMHTRVDFPDRDEAQTHRLLSGGLDDIWVRVDDERPVVGRQAEKVAS
jgi:succinate dehydrogenase/fumarate reductase flavoprotein subunit